MKKLTLLLSILFCTATLSAQTWNCGAEGNGSNVIATLSNGTLTISGTGAMMNYTGSSYPAWYDYEIGSAIIAVAIDSGVTSVGTNAFNSCGYNLTTVTIGSSVDFIGQWAFRNCTQLTTVYYNAVNCTSVGVSPFDGCTALTSVIFGNSVTHIPAVFNYCGSLTAVTLPSSVTTIRSGAFNYCSALTSVTIGNSVTNIGEGVFQYCNKLTEIINLATTPQTIYANTMVFDGVDKTTCTLWVPAGRVATYRAAAGWSDFVHIKTRVADVSLSKATATLTVGAADSLTATVTPKDATNKKMVWTSSSPTVATISAAGKVVAVGAGTATITATTEDGGFTDSCKVSVNRILVVTPTSESICSGSSYSFRGKPLTLAGAYRDTLQTCCYDSVFVLTLAVSPAYTTSLSTTICDGEEYNFRGKRLTTAGIYRDTLPTVHGCDSIFVLTLTVHPAYSTTVSETIAEGSSYRFNGKLLTTAGAYRDTLHTAHGCDSLVVLTLTVNAALPATSVSSAATKAIKLYPNPVANGVLTVECGGLEAEEPIEVYSMSGALVAKYKVAGEQTSLNVSHLASGTYLLSVGKYTAKLVKQ